MCFSIITFFVLSEVFCVPVAPRRCLERFQGGIGNAFGVFVGSPSGSLGSSENVSGGSFGAPGGGLGVLKVVSGVSGVALWGFFGVPGRVSEGSLGGAAGLWKALGTVFVRLVFLIVRSGLFT